MTGLVKATKGIVGDFGAVARRKEWRVCVLGYVKMADKRGKRGFAYGELRILKVDCCDNACVFLKRRGRVWEWYIVDYRES